MKGLKGEKKFHLHVASGNILEVVRSGESLAALLHFYLPGIVKWNGKHIHINEIRQCSAWLLHIIILVLILTI